MAEKSESKPKRKALIEVLRSDEKVDALKLVKARAALRTRTRIERELEAKEMKRLELKMARGEVTPEEAEKLASKA